VVGKKGRLINDFHSNSMNMIFFFINLSFMYINIYTQLINIWKVINTAHRKCTRVPIIILRGKISLVKTLYLLLICPCFSYRRFVRSSRFPTSDGIVEAPLPKRICVARSSRWFERDNIMYFIILYNNVCFIMTFIFI